MSKPYRLETLAFKVMLQLNTFSKLQKPLLSLVSLIFYVSNFRLYWVLFLTKNIILNINNNKEKSMQEVQRTSSQAMVTILFSVLNENN